MTSTPSTQTTTSDSHKSSVIYSSDSYLGLDLSFSGFNVQRWWSHAHLSKRNMIYKITNTNVYNKLCFHRFQELPHSSRISLCKPE